MARWTRVVGDGAAYKGPCLLLDIFYYPSGSKRYVDIYDGLGTGAGKKFCRVRSEGTNDVHRNFGAGVPFDVGIYVDGEQSDEETTIVFQPLTD